MRPTPQQLFDASCIHRFPKEKPMPSITLSRPTTDSTGRLARPSWRERRATRRLFAQISTRPQNVRNELLEFASRAR